MIENHADGFYSPQRTQSSTEYKFTIRRAKKNSVKLRVLRGEKTKKFHKAKNSVELCVLSGE